MLCAPVRRLAGSVSSAINLSSVQPLLVTLDRVSLAFGHLPLLDDVSLAIDAGERIAVLGRNGEGKSTLLKVLSGEVLPDAGVVWRLASGLVALRESVR